MVTALGPATYLAGNLKLTLGLAQMLTTDIPADKFTHMPQPTMNHPAWCYGHLALYPARVCRMLERNQCPDLDQRYTDLFAAGTTPVDDPSIYPDKDEILDTFHNAYESIVPVLSTLTDEELSRKTPHERYRDRMPRIGHVVQFLLSNHVMFHLGQVSTWRRAVGLPPAVR